ncbi:MAG TPA: PH domain-containing protein [Xanthobacteraceae bacterium]|nr:PH domain-containing protein [Xanthobacteraceae bacterium]
MSYVKSVLQPGEEVRFATDIHWMVYIPGVLLLLVAIAVWIVASVLLAGEAAFVVRIVAGLVFLAAAVLLFIGWFKRLTTEVAVTNKRIIYKRGFISRYTIEMHLDKVESVDVDQSILGRIFGYGDIIIRGVGASLEPLRNIESPIEFRSHVTAP